MIVSTQKDQIIGIRIGDSFGEGHGRTETYYMHCNYDFKEINEAFKKSCEQLNIAYNANNFLGDAGFVYCNSIGDFTFPIEVVNQIDAIDPTSPIAYDGWEDDGIVYTTIEDYLKMYLRVVKYTLKDLKVRYASIGTVNIGGYGLFDY